MKGRKPGNGLDVVQSSRHSRATAYFLCSVVVLIHSHSLDRNKGTVSPETLSSGFEGRHARRGKKVAPIECRVAPALVKNACSLGESILLE